MKKLLTLAAFAALTGCATGGGGMFAPQIVSSSSRSVTVYDMIGYPGAAEQTAAQFCASYGRTAQFQGRGGPSFHCSGRDANLCTTYSCVE